MKKCFMLALMVAGVAAASWAQPQMTPDAPAADAKSKDAKPAAKSAEAKPAAAKPADSAAPSAAPASSSSVKIEKIVAAAGVDKREPVGEGTSFGADAPVYCWTKLTVTNPPAKIKYAWSSGGKVVDEITAEIKTDTARWWTSKKNVTAGAWKVEVLSESGESLGSVDFTVTAAAAPAPAPAAAPAAAPAKADGAKK